MTDTSKALELASWIGSLTWSDQTTYVRKRLIATVEELLRQHAEIAELKAERERIRALPPVGIIDENGRAWAYSNHGGKFELPSGTRVYTLPPNLKGPVETYDQKELDEAAARAKEIVAGLKIE